MHPSHDPQVWIVGQYLLVPLVRGNDNHDPYDPANNPGYNHKVGAIQHFTVLIPLLSRTPGPSENLKSRKPTFS